MDFRCEGRWLLDIDEGIVKIVGERGSATFSEVKRAGGWSWQAAHEHVEKLVEEGVLSEKVGGFPKTRRLFLTEKGRLMYEAIKRREAAEKAVSLDGLVRALLEKVRENMPQVKALQLLAEPLGERAAELLISSIKVAADPRPEGREEEEALAEALLAFLSSLLKCRSLMEKISREKKLTFLLSMEAPNLTLGDLQAAALLTSIMRQTLLKSEG